MNGQMFEVGSLVRLLSGSPMMVVEIKLNSYGKAGCAWMVDGKVHRDSFYPECLILNNLRDQLKAEAMDEIVKNLNLTMNARRRV
jgi:uncharacterized protein YodC (DUF2158 family)